MSEPKSERWRTTLIVLVVLVVVVGVAVLVVKALADREPDVVIIGDSVTALSGEQLRSTVSGHGPVGIVAEPGWRTDELLPLAEENLTGFPQPRVGVIITGYNDVMQEVNTDEAVQEMMDVVAGVDCGIWVLIPTKGPYDPALAQAFNARVEELAADAEVHVDTAWRDAVDRTANAQPDPRLVVDDMVHPSPEGSATLARTVDEAADRWCG